MNIIHIGTNDVNKPTIPVQQAMSHAQMFMKPFLDRYSYCRRGYALRKGFLGVHILNTKVDALKVLLEKESMAYNINSRLLTVQILDYLI